MFNKAVSFTYRLQNQPKEEQSYTLMSIPSVKSQSLTVPSIEQEYACSDNNKKGTFRDALKKMKRFDRYNNISTVHQHGYQGQH